MASYAEMLKQLEAEAQGGANKPTSRYQQMLADLQASAESNERSIPESIGAWFAGKDVDPNIPTLGAFFSDDPTLSKLATSTAGRSALLGVLSSTSDDARLEKAFKMYVPDATTSKDKFGNLVVTAPVEVRDGVYDLRQFYPNPKGMDLPTATQLSGAMAVSQPLTRMIGGTGYRTAMATGAADATIVETLASYLTNSDFRWSDIPLGAGAGAAFKAAFDVAGAVIRRSKDYLSKLADRGEPTSMVRAKNDAIRQALEDEGFDGDAVMRMVYDRIDQMVNAGAKPNEAVRQATSESLPVPVPQTRGEITGEQGQQLLENTMETGGLGPVAESRMRSIREKQSQAIPQNLSEIQRQMAGGGNVIEPRAGMASAQESLGALREEAERRVKAIYTKANDTSAYIDPQYGDQAAADLYNATVKEGFRETSSPQAFAVLRDEIAPLMREGQSISDLFAARKALTKLAASSDGNERGAAGFVKSQLDQKLQQMADDTLLYGDPNSVKFFLDAINEFKDFKRLWEDNGILKRLTEKSNRDGTYQLVVAPEDAANVIFGVGLNPNKANLPRDMITLRKNLPEGVFDEVRQEFFIKLAQTIKTPAGTLTGGKFAKNWAEIKKNKTLLNTMFTEKEIAQIDALSTVALRLSGSAKNSSQSANSLANLMNKLMMSLARTPTAQAMGQNAISRIFTNAYGGAQSAIATGAPVPYRSNVNAMLGAGTGAAARDETLPMAYDYATGAYEDLRKRITGE